MNAGLWLVAGVLLATALGFIMVRNSMVELQTRVDEAWSGVDVQLRRRHDLVPALVDTVKGYAHHERKVLERVSQARADAMRALGSDPETESQVESELTRTLANVHAMAESYPDWRTTRNFQQLQRDLVQIEDEIHAARRIYNSNVQAFNTKIQTFPNSLVAGLARFTPRQYFQGVTSCELDSARSERPEGVCGSEAGGY